MVEINQPTVQLYYTELAGTDTHTQVANNAWENWDCSGFIPTGTKYVDVYGEFGSSASRGVRAGGSAVDRRLTDRGPHMLAQVDSGGIIQTYAATGIVFHAIGVWRE